ncbi:hypothetical protein SB861_37880 [Paraburkholderia sp. SIMBA_049]
MSNPDSKEVLRVLQMTEQQMMDIEIISLYQAFYALPTHYPLAMCDVRSGRGFERLNTAERTIAERIVRVIQQRCPVPKVERWKKFEAPAANDPAEPTIRITHH